MESFVDEVAIEVFAGHGGAGSVHFRRENTSSLEVRTEETEESGGM